MSILDKRNTVSRRLRALKRKDGIGEKHNGRNGNGNIEWIDVGVEGLLNFIPGLPKGDAILVRGEPGTGKTILCLQFLHKGAEKGEKGIYITTEETPETIMRTGGVLTHQRKTLATPNFFLQITNPCGSAHNCAPSETCLRANEVYFFTSQGNTASRIEVTST